MRRGCAQLRELAPATLIFCFWNGREIVTCCRSANFPGHSPEGPGEPSGRVRADGELKRDMAILATSGRDWASAPHQESGRACAERLHLSQQLIECKNGGRRITEKSREFLKSIEGRPTAAEASNRDAAGRSWCPTFSCRTGPRRHERKDSAGKRRCATWF